MPAIAGRGRRRIFLVAAASLSGLGVALLLAWPLLFPGLLGRGAAAYERGEWARSAALAEARLKEAPDDREALRLLARSEARRGRDGQAQALYDRLGGRQAMKAEDLYLFGIVNERRGDREAARSCWEAGLRDEPGHPGLLEELGRSALRRNQLTLAATLAGRLAETPGSEAHGEWLQGRIAYEQDDPTAAAQALRLALKHDPKSGGSPDAPTRPGKLLARALLRTRQPAEARARLQGVLSSGPDPEASWLLSRAHLQDGSVAEASASLAQGASFRDEFPLEPEPAPHVGSARCADCHRAIHQVQQDSLHARTFRRARDFRDVPLPTGPVPDPAQPGVRHAIERSEAQGTVRYEVREADDKAYRALVEYAFGSGHRGLTLVGRDERGRAREFRLSYYSDGPTWDLTTGHSPKPHPQENSLGRLMSPDDARSCFTCHTTVARSAQTRKGPEAADRGIGCERCHGPGGNHLRAVEAHLPDLAIARPGRASGPQVVALCAQCHSPPGRVISRDDPLAARFPGTGLTWSRCFTESGGTFDCLTCHDPHRNAESAPAAYEAKCLGCHSAPEQGRAVAGASGGGPRRTACPVNPARDCVSCHMPKVKTVIPHSLFSDHYIRVHPRRSPGDGTGTRAGSAG